MDTLVYRERKTYIMQTKKAHFPPTSVSYLKQKCCRITDATRFITDTGRYGHVRIVMGQFVCLARLKTVGRDINNSYTTFRQTAERNKFPA